MSNDKKEEKWAFNFRDDQCQFISDAMVYIAARASERIGDGKFAPFDRFASKQVKMMSEEIMSQIAEVTS